MKRPRGRSGGVRLRRGVQLAFLALFIALLLWTRPVPGRAPSPALQLFFDLDPLVALTSLLATHTLHAGALLALITLLVTVIFGRVFCGWACPLGTLHAIAGRGFEAFKPCPPREHYSPWQLSKYVLLGAIVLCAIGGVPWLALFDPLVILYRTTATALWPAAQGVIEDASTSIYRNDPGIGAWRLTALTEPAYRFLRDQLFVKPRQVFLGSTLIVAFFALGLALNAIERRFWCRFVCPLGALLGVFAWRPWLRRATASAACNHCDVCGMTCHGAATQTPGGGWKPQECLGCLNCTATCPPKGLSWRFVPPWRAAPRTDADPAPESLDLCRRHLLGAVALGLTGLVALRATPQARGTTFHPDLVRPPGARPEPDFLARCLACGVCMKICPTGGLQPTLHEAGLAGLWTPRLVPRLGYCDYECNRCGVVCPTGAIAELPLAQKKETRLGLAAFDIGRCLPYAFGRDCMVCEEHCPVPDKAIYFLSVDVLTREGERVAVRQPRVDPQRCIGCGICEQVCPFKDRPAIRVTSANESRHPDNQPILATDGYYSSS